MLNNKTLVAIVATLCAQQALAFSVNRHGHGHYHQKRDVQVVEDVEVVTEVTTVTVYADGSPVEASSTTSSAKSIYKGVAPAEVTSSSTSSTPTTTSTSSTPTTTSTSTSTTPTSTSTSSTSTTPPTTFATSTKAATTSSTTPVTTSSSSAARVEAAAVTSSSSSAAAATTTTSSSSSNKRGLAYNSGSLLSPFLNSGTKISWSYNWGQTADSSAPSDLEFVPMLWGTGSDHVDTWTTNAEAAIADGVTHFLSFNEPDNSGQANLDAATAAAAHITYMNPYSGSVKIGTPAITNSNNDGEGVEWLTNFLDACDGGCDYDFCAAHWYNDADTSDFLDHITAVHEACGKPVWITEFAPTGTDDEINTFLTTVMEAMDSNSDYDFVDRYSYFMAATGSLLTSDTELSTYGETYAYN